MATTLEPVHFNRGFDIAPQLTIAGYHTVHVARQDQKGLEEAIDPLLLRQSSHGSDNESGCRYPQIGAKPGCTGISSRSHNPVVDDLYAPCVEAVQSRKSFD